MEREKGGSTSPGSRQNSAPSEGHAGNPGTARAGIPGSIGVKASVGAKAPIGAEALAEAEAADSRRLALRLALAKIAKVAQVTKAAEIAETSKTSGTSRTSRGSETSRMPKTSRGSGTSRGSETSRGSGASRTSGSSRAFRAAEIANAVEAAEIDQRVGRVRAHYVKTRLFAAKRAAEERGKWVAAHPIVPGMTHEQRAQRLVAKRDAFSRINAFFEEWQNSAYRLLLHDLEALGRLPSDLQPDYVPKIRLEFWGRCIRTQRVDQRLKAKDLCRELGMSEATLRRVERGDPMVAAISYLRAMGRLGILTRLVPEAPDDLWRAKDEWSHYRYRSGRRRDVPYSGVRRVRDPSPG